MDGIKNDVRIKFENNFEFVVWDKLREKHRLWFEEAFFKKVAVKGPIL